MKKTIKTKWLKALRSGKYKRATGSLKRGNGYCCLGVLTDLYCKAEKKQWNMVTEYESSMLPWQVQKWAGLHSDDPMITHGWASTLSEANDGESKSVSDGGHKGLSFKKIADIIERTL